MRRFIPVTTTTLAAAALCVPLLSGCQQRQHDQWVNQANDRWLELRSAMMLEMAQQHFDTGDLDMAEKTIRDAMQIDPRNAHLHVLAGRIMLERGQLERAYHLFEGAIELQPELPDSHYYKGVVLQRWQRYPLALDSYTKAYELMPDQAAYLLAMSEMMVELNRLPEAITLLEGKLDYFDQNAALRSAIGHLHTMAGRPDRGVTYFRQAALLDPDNPKLQEELALALLACGENEEAARTLQQLVRREDMQERRDLHRALARAYVELGQVKEARSVYFELARRPSPDVADWLKLAELAWQQNDLGGTLDAANRVISLAPQRHEGYLFAGLVWQKRDRLEDALRMFDRAAELAPQSTGPLILRGLALQRAGRLAAAAEAYEAALQRQPNDDRAQRLLQSVADAMQ